MFSTLATEARQVLQKVYGLEDVSVEWDRPQDALHGDIATAVALKVARGLGKNPREIAETLVKELSASPSVSKAEVAGPGYVNIWLTPAVLLEQLEKTREACTPKVTRKKEAPIIIEYSQPNIAKPLGAHHIIGTVIGQALVNLYRHDGHNVIAWNYLGDWGTQFGKLAVAFEKWGEKSARACTLDDLLNLYVKFHEEAEKDETLEEQGRAAFLKLERGDKELRAFWEDIVAVTKQSLKGLYERLHVSFDLDLGESFYEDKMEDILKEGKTKKVFTEGEGGSLIVEFSEESGMTPYLVQKGDGATLYSTRDIAQMKYRIAEYKPSAIYILTDIAQKLHFEQLIETCKKLGWELPAFENVLFGRMRFADKSMSTRKGNILKLEHVLDEAVARADAIIKERGESIQTDDAAELGEMIGTGSLVYGILSQNRKMDIVFDWEKMLSFEGNSAPYLQYTHARAKSVLRKSETDAISIDEVDGFTAHERSLLSTLLQFPQALESARTERLPHKLATYLHQLCQDFNAFYGSDPILTAEGGQKTLRLALTSITALVIKTGAELLTLRVPERM